MFIAANTRQPATTSSVFEFDFEMEFLEVLASYQVCRRQVFPDLATYLTVQVKTSLVHTSDFAWLMTCKHLWNYIYTTHKIQHDKVMSHLLSCKF